MFENSTEVGQAKLSYDICQRAINLPSFVGIKDNEINRVCDVIFNVIAENKPDKTDVTRGM